MHKVIKILIISIIFISKSTLSFSQIFEEYTNGFTTVQTGMGTLYGGKGIRVMTNFNSSRTFTFGIGDASGTPLAFSGLSIYEESINLNKNNHKGLGLSMGIEIASESMYFGFQFISSGKYYSPSLGEMPIYGINWTAIGLATTLGRSPIFIDFSANLGLLLAKDKFDEIHVGGVLGCNIGIGYIFRY